MSDFTLTARHSGRAIWRVSRSKQLEPLVMDSGLSLREPRNDEFFRFHEFVKSKIIACLVGQITGTAPLTPRRPKGTDRDRHETLGAGCDGRS
jgi:hypothetical protein